ncbi:MAG: hypothetical protein AAFN18_00885 [Cyanobacteria bacterium J06554_6]
MGPRETLGQQALDPDIRDLGGQPDQAIAVFQVGLDDPEVCLGAGETRGTQEDLGGLRVRQTLFGTHVTTAVVPDAIHGYLVPLFQ